MNNIWLTLKFTGLIISVIVLSSCQNNMDKEGVEKNTLVEYECILIDVAGTQIYFETYGDTNNQPLLLIHGNGGSSSSMNIQREYFKEDYYVIVGDNRTHGKSGDSDNLTYELMAADYNEILNELKLDSVYIIGQSDGGIISLIMAMEYPEKVSKVVSVAPNLIPGEGAIASWELELGVSYMHFIDSMILVGDATNNWNREKQHMMLMKHEPNIPFADLGKIQCPVMLMTGDDDMILPEHMLEIYRHIPSAQLFMMPGATHFMIRDEYKLFNQMAERFLSEPFQRPTSKDVLLKMLDRK